MSAEPNADRYELFCHEYVKDFRGGAAARRAGVPSPSALSWACRALQRPEVAARIAQLKAERMERLKVEADDVLRPLVEIARTDVNELVEFRRTCCRHCYGINFGYQRTEREMRAARAQHEAAAKKAQAESNPPPEPFSEEGGVGYDRTRDPNEDCPECNGEGVGSPFIKDTRDVGLASTAYAGVKVTKDGIEVKLHDRVKALELLGRHLGIFQDNVNVKGELTVHGLAGKMRGRRSASAEDLV